MSRKQMSRKPRVMQHQSMVCNQSCISFLLDSVCWVFLLNRLKFITNNLIFSVFIAISVSIPSSSTNWRPILTSISIGRFVPATTSTLPLGIFYHNCSFDGHLHQGQKEPERLRSPSARPVLLLIPFQVIYRIAFRKSTAT